jgi:hypothetical protein
MNKNLDLLKQEFFDVKNEGILKYLIPFLEDPLKRITKLEKHNQEFLNYREISKLQIKLTELGEKIKKLEQAQTYFPPMEMEYQIDGYDNRIGGQDDRGNIFNLYEKKGD